MSNNVQPDPDDAYLSYYDVRLTWGDVDSIKSYWLTDTVNYHQSCVDQLKMYPNIVLQAISFWEEYLEHTVLTNYSQADICLLRPSMAFLLLNNSQPESLTDVLPKFTYTTHIFIPVNDNPNPDQANGGSHWSLLLYSLVDAKAFHYDSLGGHNEYVARKITGKLDRLLGSNRSTGFLALDSPQQNNGSDCGVFVCFLIQTLLTKYLLAANADERVNMSLAGKDVDARSGRKEMLRVIEEFRDNGERAQS